MHARTSVLNHFPRLFPAKIHTFTQRFSRHQVVGFFAIVGYIFYKQFMKRAQSQCVPARDSVLAAAAVAVGVRDDDAVDAFDFSRHFFIVARGRYSQLSTVDPWDDDASQCTACCFF
jgi:hypothetical protein